MIKAKRGLVISIVEGMFAQVHINLTAGMFLTSCALYIGLNDLGIGILSAIPAFFTAFAFFSIYFARIVNSRRIFCVITSGVGRGIFMILGLMFLIHRPVGKGPFFAFIIVHNILMSLSGNAWQSWMSELVPREIRGRYFGIRNTILNIVSMITNIVGGKILDFYKTVGALAHGLGLLYTSASVSSTTAATILSIQPEPPMQKEPLHLLKFILEPLKDLNFIHLLKFVSFWYLLAGIASPFYLVHMLTNLNMSHSDVAYYSIIAGVTSIVSQIVWGRAIDRFKSKPVLTLNFFCAAFLPFIWLFATKNYLLPIWIDALLTGIFWSGINLSLFNIVFSLTEEKKLKESYFAVFASVSGIFGFVASILGGIIAQSLVNIKIYLFGVTVINYHLLFVFASFARFTSLLFLTRVREKEAYSTIATLQIVGDYALKRLVIYKDLVLNTIRFQK